MRHGWKPYAHVLTVALAVTITLSGCAFGVVRHRRSRQADPSDSVTIVTSFYPMYIMTINIVKGLDNVRVVNMTPPVTGCLHDYHLTPDDVKRLTEAQIFVINGAGMESFLDKVVNQLPGLKIVEATRGVTLLKDEHGIPNPHVWVSISGAIEETRSIAEQLAVLLPEQAERLRANAQAYVARLEALKARMHSELAGVKTRDIVTFHEAFPYFAKEFGLNVVAVVEREPGTEPGAGELAAIIRTIKQADAKVLFTEPQYPQGAAQVIARETGARIYRLDPAVTGPMEPDAYIKTMEANLATLVEALSK